ncbi:MAG: hypothetical protein M0C28_22870 [Candidatus Moduliflexus flocculans]|nr:hypothetical protein [Candidatus Moduliflexus flocculans]
MSLAFLAGRPRPWSSCPSPCGVIRERRSCAALCPTCPLRPFGGKPVQHPDLLRRPDHPVLNLVLISLIFPVFILLLSRIFLGDRMPPRRLGGVAGPWPEWRFSSPRADSTRSGPSSSRPGTSSCSWQPWSSRSIPSC